MRRHICTLQHLRKASECTDYVLDQLERRRRALAERLCEAAVWIAGHASHASVHAAHAHTHASHAAIHATHSSHTTIHGAVASTHAGIWRTIAVHAAVGRTVAVVHG